MPLTSQGRSQKAASSCQEPAIASEPGVHRRHGSFYRPPDPGPSTARGRGLNRPQRVQDSNPGRVLGGRRARATGRRCDGRTDAQPLTTTYVM